MSEKEPEAFKALQPTGGKRQKSLKRKRPRLPEDDELLDFMLPPALLALSRKGLIRESDLKKPKTLWRKVQKNIKIATVEWRVSITLEDQFLEAATAHCALE
jgi:hypothetical protein